MNTTITVNEGVRTPYSYSSSFLVLKRTRIGPEQDGQRTRAGEVCLWPTL